MIKHYKNVDKGGRGDCGVVDARFHLYCMMHKSFEDGDDKVSDYIEAVFHKKCFTMEDLEELRDNEEVQRSSIHKRLDGLIETLKWCDENE